MNNLTRVGGLAVVSVLLLTGCVRVQMDVTLNEDDTASGTYVLAVQEGVGESIGAASDADAVDELFGTVAGDLEGATATEYNQDGYVGTQVTFENQSFAELNLDSDDLKIVRDGDDYVVAGEVGGGETAELGDLPADAEMSLAITFPGPIAEANGVIEGNTVTWDLTDAPDKLYARGAASQGGFPLLAWLGIAFVLLVVLAGVVLLIIGSRRSSADAPQAESAVAIDEGNTDAPPTIDGPPLP